MMENRYDKYKDSGIAWIGEIPEHWKTITIKYILKNNSLKVGPFGSQLSGSDILSKGKYWIYNQRTVLDNNYSSCNSFISNEKYNDLIGFKVSAGDILLTTRGTIGKISRIPPIFNEGVIHPCIIRFNINEKILKYEILRYIFNDSDIVTNQVKYNSNSTTIDVIYSDTLKNIVLAYIPQKEQQSIAAYLDQKCGEIDELITLQEEMITELQSYKQSVITEAITKGLDKNVPLKDSGIEWIGEIPEHWIVKRLKYVCNFNPQNDQSISKLSEVGYLPMERLKNGYMLPSVISVSNLTQGLTFFKENDIVLAKVTPCFENGNIAVAKNLVNNCGFGSSELFVFRVKSINRKYLFYLLQEGKIKDVCKSTMIGTGGLKRISPIFMKNIQLPIPSLSEQQAIADYLDQKCSEIDELISIKQQKIEKLKEYKKSLIFECVTGKRKVS